MLPLCLLQSSFNFKTSMETEVNSIRNSPGDNFKWYHRSPMCRKIPCEGNVSHSYYKAVKRLGQQKWCVGSHAADPQHPATAKECPDLDHQDLMPVQNSGFSCLPYHPLSSALGEHRGTMQLKSCGCWTSQLSPSLPSPPAFSCPFELPRVSGYKKLFRSQDTTAIC